MGCGASTPAARVAPSAEAIAAAAASPRSQPKVKIVEGGKKGGIKFAVPDQKPKKPGAGKFQRRDSVRRPGVSDDAARQQKEVADPVVRRGSLRNSVCDDYVNLNESTVIAHFAKSAETLAVIKRATADNPLFAPLDDQQKNIIYGAMVDEQYEAGETVIKEGERGDVLYCVDTGAFDATIAKRGDEVVKHYESGTAFGELALLYNSPRAATVKCVASGRLWGIDRSIFNTIMVTSNKAVFAQTQEFLKSASLLESLNDSSIDFLASVFEEYTYSVGEHLWDAEEEVETLFLIREGEVEVVADPDSEETVLCPGAPGDPPLPPRTFEQAASFSHTSFSHKQNANGHARRGSVVNVGKTDLGLSSRIITLRRGEYFGSPALEGGGGAKSRQRSSLRDGGNGTPRGDFFTPHGGFGDARHRTCGRALNRVTVLELRRSTLERTKRDAVGDLPIQLLRRVQEKAEAAFANFLTLTATQRMRLLTGLPATVCAAGATVQPEEDAGTDVDVENGSATNGELVASAKRLVQVLVQEELSTGAGSTVEAGACVDETALQSLPPRAPALALTATKGDAMIVELDCDLLVSLSSLMSTVTRRTDDLNRQAAEERADVLSLDDLRQKAVLGAGGYGSVNLVEHAATGRVFALKRMSKPHIVAKRQVDHVNNERRLLAKCDHPFVIEMNGSFQDRDYLYLLLELVLGGELFTYLDDHGPLGEGPARFYAASVCVALEYLQTHHIVYRDLKPENLLLDAKGYVKVVDFGFAKVVYPGERTWTLCGTPEYLAPEIILRKGHDGRADWWSLGVLIVELFTGFTPFASDDHFDIFKKIVKGHVDWAEHRLPTAAQEVVQGLLVAEPAERLGSVEKGGSRALKDSKFFSSMDFVRLVGRTLDAPYAPYSIAPPQRSLPSVRPACLVLRPSVTSALLSQVCAAHRVDNRHAQLPGRGRDRDPRGRYPGDPLREED